MLRPLQRTATVFAVVFLLAEAPGAAAFLWQARAETMSQPRAEIVDCVLPGQIRSLGPTTYVTRGRTIKTTKKECEARGGRPVAPKEPEVETPGGEPAEQVIHSPK